MPPEACPLPRNAHPHSPHTPPADHPPLGTERVMGAPLHTRRTAKTAPAAPKNRHPPAPQPVATPPSGGSMPPEAAPVPRYRCPPQAAQPARRLTPITRVSA